MLLAKYCNQKLVGLSRANTPALSAQGARGVFWIVRPLSLACWECVGCGGTFLRASRLSWLSPKSNLDSNLRHCNVCIYLAQYCRFILAIAKAQLPALVTFQLLAGPSHGLGPPLLEVLHPWRTSFTNGKESGCWSFSKM